MPAGWFCSSVDDTYCVLTFTMQISEVVNSMKNLMDYGSETGVGPMESLAKFPRRTLSTSSSKNDDDIFNSAESACMQLGSTRANNRTPTTTSSTNTTANLRCWARWLHCTSCFSIWNFGSHFSGYELKICCLLKFFILIFIGFF